MYYSIISGLALILNLIINRNAVRNSKLAGGDMKTVQQATVRYNRFILVANLYFITDIAWGLLYDHRDLDALFPFLFADCLLYFLFMFASMLMWMRYIVAFLDKRGRRSKVLLYAVWTMFSVALLHLIVNIFYPLIFSFNEAHEYVPEAGRHIALILQTLLCMVTSTYMLVIAYTTSNTERVRYVAVGLTCLVMETFLILQTFNPNYPSFAIGLIIGISVIHSFVEAGERKEKEIYDHIATGLANDYDAMYYINIETGEYREFVINGESSSLKAPEGRDFFAAAEEDITRLVHPDDREFAYNLYRKETMIENLRDRSSCSYKYRLMIDGNPQYYQFTLMRANDNKHFVLCEKNVNDEITAENMLLESQKNHATFSQIAESLAANYDVIYYVDAEDSSYVSYECRNIYGKLDMQKTGENFFEDTKRDIPVIVHKKDVDMASGFIDKEHFANVLQAQKSCSLAYRVVAGTKTHNVRMTVRKTGDGTHYIIGIENIDAEISREKQHLKALNSERELARRDELTGVKNKTAYNELEKSVQAGLDSGSDNMPFAIVVCDSNNLKRINDTKGHVAGDEYIKKSASILCDIFDHSPVFRVGGDEFVVFLRGKDYNNRDELMKNLRELVHENLTGGSGPILASGMAVYVHENDSLVSEVFSRADKQMYENKESLKQEESNILVS